MLGNAYKLTLLWVPGHVGSEGNEEADELVRKGAAAPLIGLNLSVAWGTCYSKEKSKEPGRSEEITTLMERYKRTEAGQGTIGEFRPR